jgi:hypothetical protein
MLGRHSEITTSMGTTVLQERHCGHDDDHEPSSAGPQSITPTNAMMVEAGVEGMEQTMAGFMNKTMAGFMNKSSITTETTRPRSCSRCST